MELKLSNKLTMIDKQISHKLSHLCKQTVGIYDFQEMVIEKIFGQVVCAGDIVIDGGAHLGRHTRTLATLVGNTGEVFAIEPLPHLASQLTQYFRHNRNIHIIPKALSNNEQRASFCYVTNNPSYSGLKATNHLENAEVDEIKVQTITLDHVLSDQKACRLIKLDLEGGEYNALLGAKRTLKSFSPIIILESGWQQSAQQYGYSQREFYTFWKDCGYYLYDLTGIAISGKYWNDRKPYWENLIAVKLEEDIAFMHNFIPNLIVQALLEMHETHVKFSQSLFKIMKWIEAGHEVFLFGAGNRARLILDQYPIAFKALIDNDSGKWGKKLCGLNILEPACLDAKNEKLRMVIMSLFGSEIEKQLLDMGFTPKNILKIDIR
jgi:FkbM family methyltransferase